MGRPTQVLLVGLDNRAGVRLALVVPKAACSRRSISRLISGPACSRTRDPASALLRTNNGRTSSSPVFMSRKSRSTSASSRRCHARPVIHALLGTSSPPRSNPLVAWLVNGCLFAFQQDLRLHAQSSCPQLWRSPKPAVSSAPPPAGTPGCLHLSLRWSTLPLSGQLSPTVLLTRPCPRLSQHTRTPSASTSQTCSANKLICSVPASAVADLRSSA